MGLTCYLHARLSLVPDYRVYLFGDVDRRLSIVYIAQ
jgi:hypothetical protein